jgi:hypothetical protein
MTGNGSAPRLGQGEHDRDQGPPDEQTQKAERDEAAKKAEDGQRHHGISMPKPISQGLMMVLIT